MKRLIVIVSMFLNLQILYADSSCLLGTNIIENSSFEGRESLSKWTQHSGNAKLVRVNYASGWAGLAPSGAGSSFLYATGGNRLTVNQTIDISACMDEENRRYDFSSLFGGYGDGDTIAVELEFKDDVQNVVKTYRTKNVTSKNKMSLFSQSEILPSNISTVTVSLIFNRAKGRDIDGYLDNLSLVIKDNVGTPPPRTTCKLGTNIIKNSSFEGTESLNKWTQHSGNAKLVRVNYASGWAGLAPSGAGSSFLYATGGNRLTVNQTIDISACMDEENRRYDFSSLFGGYGDGDTIAVELEFKDDVQNVVKTYRTKNITSKNKMNLFSQSEILPSNITTVTVSLIFNRAKGRDIDGYLDNLSLVVKKSTTFSNITPEAIAQSVTVDEDTTDNLITLAGMDEDGDTLTYAIVAQPTHGSVTLNGNIVKYTPTTNYFGADSFSFKVNDGTVNSSPAVITITVTDVAEPNEEWRIAKDNTGSDVQDTMTLGNYQYSVKVYSNKVPNNEDNISNGSYALYGNVNGEQIILRLNSDYPTDTKFQVKVFDVNGINVGESNIVEEYVNPIEFSHITIDTPEATIEEKIVERHNYYRKLDFQDSDLTWDATLADHAQQWADYLASHYTQSVANATTNDGRSPHASKSHWGAHGLPYEGEGENIAPSSISSPAGYLTSEPVDISVANLVHDQYIGGGEGGAVDAWANEKAYYDYPSNSGNGNLIGHYTQVVWQKTTKVGCGKANSHTDYKDTSGQDVEWVVCRYSIGGNMVGEKPYCSNYTVSDLYTETNTLFTNAMIKDASFDIVKVLENRSLCTRTDNSDSTLIFTGATSATISDYNAFNTSDSSNLWNMDFNNIQIDGEGQLIMSNSDHNRYMKLKIIGENTDYYSVEGYWWVKKTQYERRAILKLMK